MVPLGAELAQAGRMSCAPAQPATPDSAGSGVVIDLHDYLRVPEPRLGRPAEPLEGWRVVDDWPRRVPVTSVEVDVFEAWFGDILDELFGPA